MQGTGAAYDNKLGHMIEIAGKAGFTGIEPMVLLDGDFNRDRRADLLVVVVPSHVMRETASLRQLQQAGFSNIELSHRMAVNALVTAIKPVNASINY